MKYEILLRILFDLLAKRKVTARYLAEKYEISQRTVYRYIDELSIPVPIQVQTGRNGGILISDNYKLPMGFMTKEEYEAAINALTMAYQQLPEESFLDARRKLSAKLKEESRDTSVSGEIGTNVLIDGGTWGDTRKFAEKMRLVETAVNETKLLEIDYCSRTGENTHREIEPHILVFKQGIWYIYAYCRKQQDFRLFKISRIVNITCLEETFPRRNVSKSDVKLDYWTTSNSVDILLEVSEDATADVQDFLGAESIRKTEDGKCYAEANLPCDETLVKKILGLGNGVKVISPESLKEKVKETVKGLYETYSK